ncbi:MAG: hypothetical protein VW268_06855 [Rhodospirillaceae bacterium]
MIGLCLVAWAFAAARAAPPDPPYVVRPCLECHSVNTMKKKTEVPSLVGQDDGYLRHQIKAFNAADNAPARSPRLVRRHPVMTEQAKEVSVEDAFRIARWFYRQACFPARALEQPRFLLGPPPAFVMRCFLCYGPGGKTTHALVPSLAGQRARHLACQLLAFCDALIDGLARDGRYRSHRMMNRQGTHLTNAEIAQLADYFSRLDRR